MPLNTSTSQPSSHLHPHGPAHLDAEDLSRALSSMPLLDVPTPAALHETSTSSEPADLFSVWDSSLVDAPAGASVTSSGFATTVVPPTPTSTPSSMGVSVRSFQPKPAAARVSAAILRVGSRGPAVKQLQQRLAEHGFTPGPIDGIFGSKTRAAVRAFQRANGLVCDALVGPKTRGALANGLISVVKDEDTSSPTDGKYGTYAPGAKFAPGSPAAIALFERAAELAGVPKSWAHSNGLYQILLRESGGIVGIPNYTYGSRNNPSRWPAIHRDLEKGMIRAKSSATGLGQLLLSNVDKYYPAGRGGIGVPEQEAAGMLRYIKARYGSPAPAWKAYNKHHEGY